jgi:hypothetical protein
MSLRGAVGAIERNQTPFVSWLRESTLVLPLFVCGVLAAMALALRWRSRVGRGSRASTTGLLVAGAGTVVGIIALVASSAYDYRLQASAVSMMSGMGTASCATGDCRAQELQSTLLLQVRSVGYGTLLLVVSNLVVVAWVMAVMGGRLRISRAPRDGSGSRLHPLRRAVRPANRMEDVAVLLAAGLAAAAVVHLAVVPEHLSEWPAAAVFFVLLAAAELLVAVLALTRPGAAVWVAAAAVSVLPLVVWSVSRTVGMPFGPEAGTPEAVGLADCASCLLELGALLAAALLMRRAGRLIGRPPAWAHVGRLGLVAVVAVAAFGLAGSGIGWLDALGSASMPTSSHGAP